MMQTFKRPMRKDFKSNGQLKQYIISLGVKTEINEERFYKNDKDKIVCDVIIAFPDEFEKMANEHEEFQSRIPSLEEAINKKDKEIKDLQNRLSSIDADHEKEIKKLKKEYAEEVEQLKADNHEKDLEIERTKTKYSEEIGEFRERIQKEINGLELFDEDKHMLIKDHNEELSNLELFDAEYHMKKEDHQKALNKMRGNCLKLRVRENKEYSSYIEELDNLGRLDKFRNKDKAILKEMRGYNRQTIDDKAIDVNFNLIEKEK